MIRLLGGWGAKENSQHPELSQRREGGGRERYKVFRGPQLIRLLGVKPGGNWKGKNWGEDLDASEDSKRLRGIKPAAQASTEGGVGRA